MENKELLAVVQNMVAEAEVDLLLITMVMEIIILEVVMVPMVVSASLLCLRARLCLTPNKVRRY